MLVALSRKHCQMGRLGSGPALGPGNETIQLPIAYQLHKTSVYPKIGFTLVKQ